ncbi:MAG: hypothetical protein GXP42_02070 [Chloroflexi bacterium]|nr:hypothetical protein [Chloroflexota bacterium]
MNTGRIAGIILIVISSLIFVAAGVLFAAQLATEETATVGGQVLGMVMVFICLVIPLSSVGVYLLIRGRAEEQRLKRARKERTILNMVLTQGKVNLSEVALELDASRDEVEELVRDLVGKNLFTGAINWNDGILYSKEASALKADRKCPNCGGELELAGKGVIQCPWCGAEVFIHTD